MAQMCLRDVLKVFYCVPKVFHHFQRLFLRLFHSIFITMFWSLCQKCLTGISGLCNCFSRVFLRLLCEVLRGVSMLILEHHPPSPKYPPYDTSSVIQFIPYQGSGLGLFCCISTNKGEEDTTHMDMEEMDRVENAFRKFDTDGDGFIDWEEFKQVLFYFVLKTLTEVLRLQRILTQIRPGGYLKLVIR